MRTYGNDWLRQFQPKRMAILLGRPLTWMPHMPRLNRTKKLRKQSGKPRVRDKS